jgi:hypothetical protein
MKAGPSGGPTTQAAAGPTGPLKAEQAKIEALKNAVGASSGPSSGQAAGGQTGPVKTPDNMAAKVDQLSELSETESLRLQMAMDRVSKFMQTLSNMEQKLSNTEKSITNSIK